jgi:hypothetical protein
MSGSVSDDEARKKYPGGWKAPGHICGSFRSRINGTEMRVM